MTKKTMSIAAAALMFCGASVLTSCGPSPETTAKSVHVDSTNESGTAPVRYGADNPADTTQNLQPSDDTGRRSNTEQR